MSSSATLSKRVGEDWIPPLSDYAGSMPPLPPVKAVNPDIYVGPTEESNWVIFGKLLVGAYPSSVHDDVNTRILSGILRLGVTTFVCLQQEYQHEGVKEFEWRSGYKLRPYIFDAIKLVDSLPPSFFPTGVKPEGLEFVHFPIVDCSIANDASVLKLAHDLVARLTRGENMYLHCWGGHGRTGTVVSIMLGLLYGISPLDAMRWVQFCHDLRIAPMGTPSPQTEAQRQQVIRILNAVHRQAARSRATALLSPQPSTGPRPSTLAMAPTVRSPVKVSPSATAAPKPAVARVSQPTVRVRLGSATTPQRPVNGVVSVPAADHRTTASSSSSRPSTVQNPLRGSASQTLPESSGRPSSALPKAESTAQIAAATKSMTPQLVNSSVSIEVPASLSKQIAARSAGSLDTTAEPPPPPQLDGINVQETLQSVLGSDTTRVDASVPNGGDAVAAAGGHMPQIELELQPAAELLTIDSDDVSPDRDTELFESDVTQPHAALHSKSYVILEGVKHDAIPQTSSSEQNETSPKPMHHISPRPASLVSLTEVPRLENVLKDPVATAVAPLVSNAASVLGLGELVASRSHLHHTIAPVKPTSPTNAATERSTRESAGASTSVPTVRVSLDDPSLFAGTPKATPNGTTTMPSWPSSLAGGSGGQHHTPPSTSAATSLPRTVVSSGFGDMHRRTVSGPTTYSAGSYAGNRSGSVPTRARMLRDPGYGDAALAVQAQTVSRTSTATRASSTLAASRTTRPTEATTPNRSGSIPRGVGVRPVPVQSTAPATVAQSRTTPRTRIQIHSRNVLATTRTSEPTTPSEGHASVAHKVGPHPPSQPQAARHMARSSGVVPKTSPLVTRSPAATERPASPSRVKSHQPWLFAPPSQTRPGLPQSVALPPQTDARRNDVDLLSLATAGAGKSSIPSRETSKLTNEGPTLRELLTSLLPDGRSRDK